MLVGAAAVVSGTPVVSGVVFSVVLETEVEPTASPSTDFDELQAATVTASATAMTSDEVRVGRRRMADAPSGERVTRPEPARCPTCQFSTGVNGMSG